jgi:hypothetical protein
MALTVTSLAVAQSATELSFKATSATGATVGGFAKIGEEFERILAINGTTISVARRGEFGGRVTAHTILESVVFGLDSDTLDLPAYEVAPLPFTEFDMVNIGANGAIAVPTRPTHYFISKGSALASSTFADPSAAQNGLVVKFTGVTDFAHVVTTVSVHDGTTGDHTTLTSPAFSGGTLTLIAYNTEWFVVANNLWVIT